MEENNTNKVSTHSILERIGFQEIDKYKMQFDFGNCELLAVRAPNQNLIECYTFMGVWKTNRSIGQINFELALEFETFYEGLAFIAYYLKGAKFDFTPLWLKEGFSLKHLLPWEKQREAYEKRMEVWEKIPKAQVEHEWFRMIVRKMRSILETSTEEDITTFSFDGEILKIKCNDQLLVCPAKGKAWGKSGTVKTISLVDLPKRIKKQYVNYVYIEEDELHIGFNRFEILN